LRAADDTFKTNKGHTINTKDAIELDVFNFIVLSLRTYEDKKSSKNGEKDNVLTVLFDFDF